MNVQSIGKVVSRPTRPCDRWHWLSLLVFLWALAPRTCPAELPPSFHTSVRPPWVEDIAPTSTSKGADEQDKGGQFLKLLDTQVNVETQESFTHVIKQIVNATGVQEGANLGFAWDPTYQDIVVHQITIHRAAERLDRLEPAKFRIIQQETDLDRQIYNGRLSAVLFLEDVRVGDEIEYAYTIHGQNPSLKGRYSEAFMMGTTSPIGERRVRVLWPKLRLLRFQGRGTDLLPEVSYGALTQYVWDSHDIPAVTYEDQTPEWFAAFPWVQLSEFQSWAEVATWAAGLYPDTNRAPSEFSDELARLQSTNFTPEERIRAALEFTQNDIRYLGIEFGPGSYRPSDPLTVLRRRFGDCKDKAFLFCALVRGLGYEADPVLVATGMRQKLPELLPSPYDFDHVIARVRANGWTYWLDPTRSYQRGPISERFLPNYGFGLVVREGETQLCAIPFSQKGAPASYTSETFRIRGQKEAAEFQFSTTYKGFDAEWMRAILASEGREKFARSYFNDYAQRYPGIQAKSQMLINDASNADMLSISQTYSISNFWRLTQDKEQYRCEFYPEQIHSWITKPATAARRMPLELSYPRTRRVETTLELPRDFKLSNATDVIAGPGAELRIKRHYQERKVWLSYEYEALTNSLPVSLVAEHLESLTRMENALGYTLKWQSGSEAGDPGAWPVLILAGFYAILLVAGAVLVYSHQGWLAGLGASIPPLLPGQSLEGLGGWLIVVALGLIASVTRLLIAIVRSLSLFSVGSWRAMTHPGAVSYSPFWGPVLVFELLGQLTILALAAMALLLFFQKRRLFPRLFIGLLAANAVFIIIDSIAAYPLQTVLSKYELQMGRNIFSAIVGSSIWIPYMLRSRRVKATFIK